MLYAVHLYTLDKNISVIYQWNTYNLRILDIQLQLFVYL